MNNNNRRKRRAQSATKVSTATEFTDFHGLLELFGLRRTTALQLIKAEPELKAATISLKSNGKKRGKRLFHVAKIRRWLEAKMLMSTDD
jgi:hypothetical protein